MASATTSRRCGHDARVLPRGELPGHPLALRRRAANADHGSPIRHGSTLSLYTTVKVEPGPGAPVAIDVCVADRGLAVAAWISATGLPRDAPGAAPTQLQS